MHVLDAGVSLGWRGEDRRCEYVSGGQGGGRNHALELLSTRYDHLFICVYCVLSGFGNVHLCEIP